MIGIRKSLALSFAERYSALLISSISLPILSRLLRPDEIGTFSVGVAIVAVAHTFRDFGIGNYLIQERELSRSRVATAFAVALLMAWTLAAVLALASGPIGTFYRNTGVTVVVRILALNFVIIPFGMIALSLLRREMNFGALYRMALTSNIAHAVTAVGLAFLGFGFRALAWASVVGNLATAYMACRLGPSYAWRTPSLAERRRIFSFGIYSTAGEFVRQLGTSAPDLVIGRLLTLADVGFFSRANGLISLFNQAVTTAVAPVAQSVLALSHRDGTGAKAPFLKATCLVTVVAWPFFIFMGLMAYPIVRILFGDQWDEAVPLVRLLSIAALVRSSGLLNLTLLSATGAIAQNLRLQIILQPASILLVILASLHGLEWVAGAVIASAVLFVVLSYVAVNELIGNSTHELVSALSPSLAVAVSCGAAPLIVALTVSIGPTNLWLPLILAGIGAALGWTLAVFATRHPIASEIRVLLRARQCSRPRHS